MNNAMKLVLIKMCTYVNVKYDDIDFKKEDWYLEHTWTAEQEKDFCDWLVNEIRTNNDIRKGITTLPYRPILKRAQDVVMWFNLMWGWKTKITKEIKTEENGK